MPPSRGSSRSTDRSCDSYIPCIGRQVLYHERHLEAQAGLGGEFGNAAHAQQRKKVKRTLGVLPHETPATEANIDLV